LPAVLTVILWDAMRVQSITGHLVGNERVPVLGKR
jgi:hypothetical protein